MPPRLCLRVAAHCCSTPGGALTQHVRQTVCCLEPHYRGAEARALPALNLTRRASLVSPLADIMLFRSLLIACLVAFSSAFMAPVAPRTSQLKFSKVVMDGKGFGGGEATRDPEPTDIDPNDPKGKQQARPAPRRAAPHPRRTPNTMARTSKGCRTSKACPRSLRDRHLSALCREPSACDPGERPA